MDHQEMLSQAHEATKAHPALGKALLLIAIVALLFAKFNLSDGAALVSILSGSAATGYYIWRWRSEYKKEQRFNKPNKHTKHHG